jgi:hypothetical protein
MNEPLILPVRTGTLKRKSILELKQAGVIVVEHPNPTELKLLRPTSEVDGGQLLKIAIQALCKKGEYGNKGELQRETFAVLLNEYLNPDTKE